MKLKNKKTGEIADLKHGGYLKSDNNNHIIVYPEGTLKYYGYNSLTELNAEWEDYEEPKMFYWIDFDGKICSAEVGTMDRTRIKEIGNYFETKEEAEKAVEKLKAWKRLKDKGFELDAVVDTFFYLDIFMTGEPYEEIKDDLKIVFEGEE